MPSFTLPPAILHSTVRPTELGGRFASIIDHLCLIVAAYIATDRTAGELITLIWTRLRRRGVRFAALLARFRAGTLPPPRPPRPRTRRAPADGRPPHIRLPRTPGWLLRVMPQTGVAAYGAYLRQLLEDPEMLALLAAAPQAGRLLRPLLTALSIDPLPEVLRPPPKPKAAPADPAEPVPAATGQAPPQHPPDPLRPRRPRRIRARAAPSPAPCRFLPA